MSQLILHLGVGRKPPVNIDSSCQKSSYVIPETHKLVRVANISRAFDAETPPYKPHDSCSYCGNPFWCTAFSGGVPL